MKTTILEILKNTEDGEYVDFSTIETADQWELNELISEASDETVDDGGENTLWFFEGLGVLHSGDQSPYYWDAGATSIKDSLSNWDFGNYGDSFLNLCASFDICPDVEEAPHDSENVRIWIEWNYYDGVGNPTNCYFTSDDDWEPLVFDTFAEAKKHIDELESGVYHLSHNEACRPTYTIVEA